jgi:predicted dehydrogenase
MNYAWGFLGASGIANAMANDFALAGLNIRAVAARDLNRAQAFANNHDIETAYGDYNQLVNDPTIDIIYVSTLNHVHFEHALLAIRAGKHVLVEKPFTMNAHEAQLLQAEAKLHDVMVMEAMWTRFLPSHLELQKVIETNELGEIRLLQASHNQLLTHIERLQDPAVGGGAMLDLGIYPLSFAYRILGSPTAIHANGKLTPRGVDEWAAVSLEYASGAGALLTTCMSAAGSTTAEIIGTKARIEIDGPFYNNVSWRVIAPDNTVIREYNPEPNGRGMQHQALHFEECLSKGLKESPILPLGESVQIMKAMDAVIEQIHNTSAIKH